MLQISELSKTFANARAEIDEHFEGVLPLGTRKKLWCELAALSDERQALTRRVRLNILCVRRVLHHWTALFEPREIEEMLSLAEGLLSGAVDEATADDRRGRFYTDVIDNRQYGTDPSAMFVGHAAANTVIEAMIPTTRDALPSVDDDEDLDPENYHPSYMAACAAAGGLNGRPSDADSRRQFWRWYLREAIPSVYQL